MNLVWLVLQWKGEKPEIQGVFSTKERAEAACHSDAYSVIEIEVDKEEPAETVFDTTGQYVPTARLQLHGTEWERY